MNQSPAIAAMRQALRDNDMPALAAAARLAATLERADVLHEAVSRGHLPAAHILAPTVTAQQASADPLVTAIHKDNAALVQYLVGLMTPSPTNFALNLENAIAATAQAKSTTALALLLDLGVAPLQMAQWCADALIEASRRGNADAVRMIMGRAKPCAKKIAVAVAAAIDAGHEEITDCLLPHANLSDPSAPALCAAAASGDLALFKKVFMASVCGHEGRKLALKVAAKAGHIDIIEALLPHISKTDANNALCRALYSGQRAAALVMTQHLGADVSRRTVDIALDVAALAGNIDLATLFLTPPRPAPKAMPEAVITAIRSGHHPMMTMLLAHPNMADPSQDYLERCLYAAALAGRADMVSAILPKLPTASIRHALDPAVSSGNTALVERLLDDPETHVELATAISSAAMHANPEILAMLMAKERHCGADSLQRNLDIAAATGCGQTAAVLLAAGATPDLESMQSAIQAHKGQGALLAMLAVASPEVVVQAFPGAVGHRVGIAKACFEHLPDAQKAQVASLNMLTAARKAPAYSWTWDGYDGYDEAIMLFAPHADPAVLSEAIAELAPERRFAALTSILDAGTSRGLQLLGQIDYEDLRKKGMCEHAEAILRAHADAEHLSAESQSITTPPRSSKL